MIHNVHRNLFRPQINRPIVKVGLYNSSVEDSLCYMETNILQKKGEGMKLLFYNQCWLKRQSLFCLRVGTFISRHNDYLQTCFTFKEC